MPEADHNESAHTWQRFFAELKRRRVFRVMAIYGGAAFASLEAVDLVSGGLPVPPAWKSTLTVLVLAGFPVAVVLSWVFDITPDGVQRTDPARTLELDEIVSQPARVRWPAGLLALVGSGLFLVAAWSAASGLGWLERTAPREAYAVDDPRGSYVVLPFEHFGQSPEERDLAEQAATRLARQLRGWESVRVVPDFALAGALHDLGAESAVLPSLDLGLAIGRAQRVGTLIALTAQIQGDSASLEALLYDVGLGSEASLPIQVTAATGEVDGLVAPVTQEILQLRDRTVPLGTLRSESSSPAAHREFQAGLDALYDWRLLDAESHFRAAIGSDSTFALPVHYLALTLYWMTARNPERIVDIGPEIARLTVQADGLAAEGGLRPGLRDHVRAFRAFWEGPELPLSYGLLFEIDEQVADAVIRRGCPAVERPGGAPIPPFASRSVQELVAFCPIPGDSIGWVPQERWEDLDRSMLDRRIADMLGATTQLLERWVAVRSDQARPHEESAHFALWQRNLESCSTGSERADSLSALALRHLEAGLALRPDTTAEDLVRLAMLRLSADDLIGAEKLVDAALERFRTRATTGESMGPAVPQSTANLYLATGQPRRAHDLLRPTWDQTTFGAADPTDADEVLMAGPVEPWFGRLRTAGAAGVTGPPLDSLFRQLERVWVESGFSSDQRAVISHAALQLGIGPALAGSPEILVDWVEAWEEHDLEVPVALRGLAAVERESTSASDLLFEASDGLENSQRVSPSGLFLVAILAERTGQDSIAADLFGRLAACPLGLDLVDLGWGLRTQSFVHRGFAYQSVGDRSAAREAFAEAARLWHSAEPELRSLAARATAGAIDRN
ncbi:MAG: hypothetical protein P8125_12425 [Gemmatimonadota bacterium]